METKFVVKRGNLDIVGLEYRPNGATNLPIVVLSHGFMANMKMCQRYAKWFAEQGYAAYIFDFNGGGMKTKSSGKSTDMSVLTEVEDLKAVIDYTLSLDYTSSSLTLLGGSQGGFVSAITASELQEKVEKLILLYPAFCIPDDARSGKMIFMKFDPKNPPEKFGSIFMKLGRRYITDVVDMDAFEVGCKYEGPTLIIHGTADKVVNVEYGKKAASTFKNATLKLIEGGAHVFKGKDDDLAIEYMKEFISK